MAVKITVPDGRELTYREAAAEFGVNRDTLRSRIEVLGWSVEEALRKPARPMTYGTAPEVPVGDQPVTRYVSRSLHKVTPKYTSHQSTDTLPLRWISPGQVVKYTGLDDTEVNRVRCQARYLQKESGMKFETQTHLGDLYVSRTQ